MLLSIGLSTSCVDTRAREILLNIYQWQWHESMLKLHLRHSRFKKLFWGTASDPHLGGAQTLSFRAPNPYFWIRPWSCWMPFVFHLSRDRKKFKSMMMMILILIIIIIIIILIIIIVKWRTKLHACTGLDITQLSALIWSSYYKLQILSMFNQ